MRVFLFLCAFTLLFPSLNAAADVSDKTVANAKAFVQDMTSEGIGLIQNQTDDPAALTKSFRTLLNRDFDMDYIGRFAMGRYWRGMNASQQKEYLSLFEDMIVDVYSKRFQDYDGQKLVVYSARPDGKYDVLVNSAIIPPSGPKIRVDWRVREKNGRYKVIDIMVEGVSMALTQRSDFSSVIQRGGGDVEVLIEHLKKY